MTVSSVKVSNSAVSSNPDYDVAVFANAAKDYQAVVPCKSDGTALEGAVLLYDASGNAISSIVIDRDGSRGVNANTQSAFEFWGNYEAEAGTTESVIVATDNGAPLGYIAKVSYASSTAAGQIARIVAVTENTFTVSPPFTAAPAENDIIEIWAPSFLSVTDSTVQNAPKRLYVTQHSGESWNINLDVVTVYSEHALATDAFDMTVGGDSVQTAYGRFGAVQISGTWTGTISFKTYIRQDVSTAVALAGTNLATGNLESSTTANGIWRFDLGGIPRIYLTSAGSGTGLANFNFSFASV